VRRRAITSLLALADRGLAERAWPLIRATLEDKDALWPRYVRRDWLWGVPWSPWQRVAIPVERVVLWSCYGLERWRSALDERLASG